MALAVDPVDRPPAPGIFDPPPRELITGDKAATPREVASYVAWRVVDPDRFLRSAGTLDAAEARLNERVAAALSHAFGSRDLATIASNDPHRPGRLIC